MLFERARDINTGQDQMTELEVPDEINRQSGGMTIECEGD